MQLNDCALATHPLLNYDTFIQVEILYIIREDIAPYEAHSVSMYKYTHVDLTKL